MMFCVNSNSTLSINYIINNNKKHKILIEKDNDKYSYDHVNDQSIIPLQLGLGQYKVGLYEQISGTNYSTISKTTIENQCSNLFSVFLCSNIIVNYDSSKCLDNVLLQIVKNKNAKLQVSIVGDFIKDKLSYDKEKANDIQLNPDKYFGYIPNIDSVYNSGLGICYDYSVLFAAILRSLNIPCKVIFGHVSGVYHAWNEVYYDDKWNRFDLTFEDGGFSQFDKLNYIPKYYY